MCVPIQRFANDVLYPVFSGLGTQAQKCTSVIEHVVNWLDKKIVDLTHSILPKPVAAVAAAFIKSLPFIAARFFLPVPLLLATIGVVVIYKAATTPKGQPVSTPTMENGFGFGGILNALRVFLPGSSKNLGTIAWSVFNIFTSCILFGRSGLVSEVFGNEQATAGTQPQSGGEPQPNTPQNAPLT